MIFKLGLLSVPVVNAFKLSSLEVTISSPTTHILVLLILNKVFGLMI